MLIVGRDGTVLLGPPDLQGEVVKTHMKRSANVIADQFSPSPGGVRVRAALHANEEGVGMARISVSDQGPGIAEESKARIFTRFAQADSPAMRRSGGTGLGLAICKDLVQMQGGRISFESEAGRGATFHVELPLMVEEGLALS